MVSHDDQVVGSTGRGIDQYDSQEFTGARVETRRRRLRELSDPGQLRGVGHLANESLAAHRAGVPDDQFGSAAVIVTAQEQT